MGSNPTGSIRSVGARRQAALAVTALDALNADRLSLAYTTTVYAASDNSGDVARVLEGVLADLATL